MDFREIIVPMAIETAAFEDKTPTPVQAVALCALHARNWRMLVKRLKGRGRIRTDKKMRFLLAASHSRTSECKPGDAFSVA
jgi:hypothetical protein